MCDFAESRLLPRNDRLTKLYLKTLVALVTDTYRLVQYLSTAKTLLSAASSPPTTTRAAYVLAPAWINWGFGAAGEMARRYPIWSLDL